jgi:hypothetical protein
MMTLGGSRWMLSDIGRLSSAARRRKCLNTSVGQHRRRDAHIASPELRHPARHRQSLRGQTYQGARSAVGPFLGMLGASAFVISAVSGGGELVGYGLRLWSV